MKKMLMVAVLVGFAGQVQAETFPGSITREPLVRGRVSERLSVGLGYDRIERDIKFSDGTGTDVLEADAASGYVGYDLLPWLTTYVTAGGTSLRGDRWNESDYALRLGGGVTAYLWESDVLTPTFAAGRISLKAMAEVVRHETDTAAGSSDWLSLGAALPIGYEIFDQYPASKSGLATSLALYVGPMVSVLDGDLAVSPGLTRGFEEDQSLGVVAGVDVYFAPPVSVGFKALFFDGVTTGATLRFHF